MKKIIIIFTFIIIIIGSAFSDELSPVYRFTIFGKEHCNSVGVIYDYPFEDENHKYCMTGTFGFAFNTEHFYGIDTEYYLGKLFHFKNGVNKFGLCSGVISLTNSADTKIVLKLNAFYDLNYVLDKRDFASVYMGFVLDGGCGYVLEKDEGHICPVISAGIAIGLLF